MITKHTVSRELKEDSTLQKGPEKPPEQAQVPSGAQLPRPRQVTAASQAPGQGCRLQRCAVEGRTPGHRAESTLAPFWSVHVTALVVRPPADVNKTVFETR